MDCVFCSIVSGDLPSTPVHEDETTLAFMDIQPGTRGHVLVVPKVHATDVHDIPDDDLAAVMRTAKKVAGAATRALGCDGVNIAQSNGSAAFQTVFHFHVHVIPRYAGDGLRLMWTPAPAEPDELTHTAALLADALS